MTRADAAAFWSYAHADEKADGRILQLATDIRDEFSLITGTDLTLFVDRTDLQWGQAWRECIETALGNAAFLIPIITPRYFTRDECRRELQRFHTTAAARGFSKLLLPILYAEVDGLEPDSPDELVGLVARTQYIDWTALRLADPASSEYRSSVNHMAKRLREVLTEVVTEQIDAEQVDAEDSRGELISGAAQALADKLPSWLELVLADRAGDRQVQAIQTTYDTRLSRLSRSHAPASQRLAVIQRMASEVLPLTERHLEYAKAYSAATIEIDPLAQRALDLVSGHPDEAWILDAFRDAVGEAIEVIREDEARGPRAPALSNYANVSRLAKKIQDIWKACERYVTEANSIVTKWDEQLQSLSPQTTSMADSLDFQTNVEDWEAPDSHQPDGTPIPPDEASSQFVTGMS